MPQVILTSEEFGDEEFDYDTVKEARAGFNQLRAFGNNEIMLRRISNR